MQDKSTNDVVKETIIPETAKEGTCYMESDFMQKTTDKGGQVAKKLVSHAWKSRFLNTVVNILLDASDMDSEQLKKTFSTKDGKEDIPADHYSRKDNDPWEQLIAHKALKDSPPSKLMIVWWS